MINTLSACDVVPATYIYIPQPGCAEQGYCCSARVLASLEVNAVVTLVLPGCEEQRYWCSALVLRW
jgi:hypothetical protein